MECVGKREYETEIVKKGENKPVIVGQLIKAVKELVYNAYLSVVEVL